ncbi:MAG: tripartite tricarboxylate transporter permease, partial [Eubacterium sp.]
MLEYITSALGLFASWEVLLALVIGVVAGMAIGIIPGLGPSVGIALLIPITFSMSPQAALIMMTAMYTTGVYGGS